VTAARLRGAFTRLPANLRGAMMVSLGAFILVTMTTLVKSLGESLHSFEIVFFRCLIGFLFLTPLLFRARGRWVPTKRPFMHILRAFVGGAAMFCIFWSVTHMPLADATAIVFSRPLFMIVLAFIFLGEVVGWRRGFATLAGFTGILIVTRPFTEGFEPTALIAASGALFAAMVVVVVKKLALTEPVMTIMFYYTLWTTVISAIPAALVWQTPNLYEMGVLIGVGILGVAGQTAMTHGFKLGEATFVVPFDYLRLVFATLYGIALFREIPTIISITGAAVIVASSFYILRRGAAKEEL
jgi:drug/metabolite transporter (DMT)-like permease